MNGHAGFTTLEQLDSRLEGLRSLLWLLYLDLCQDDDQKERTAAVDAILEYAVLCDRTLQEYLEELAHKETQCDNLRAGA